MLLVPLGSLDPGQELTFNYRLVQGEEEIVDSTPPTDLDRSFDLDNSQSPDPAIGKGGVHTTKILINRLESKFRRLGGIEVDDGLSFECTADCSRSNSL